MHLRSRFPKDIDILVVISNYNYTIITKITIAHEIPINKSIDFRERRDTGFELCRHSVTVKKLCVELEDSLAESRRISLLCDC